MEVRLDNFWPSTPGGDTNMYAAMYTKVYRNKWQMYGDILKQLLCSATWRGMRITGRMETPRTIGTATVLRAGHAFTHKLPPQSYSKTRLYPLH